MLGHRLRYRMPIVKRKGPYILGRITFYFIAGFRFITSLFFLFAEPLVRIFTQPPFYEASQVLGL